MNNKAADCTVIQQIEKEYINSMLDIDQLDISPVLIQHEIIDHNEAYTKNSIECRVFNIAGINIAVPASSIREIIKQQTLLSNSENNAQITICAGTIDYNNEIIDVIDIENLVMNKHHTPEKEESDVVVLKGSSTGFLYDELLDSQTISSEHIHWRDAESKRIWLAGTAAQIGLALLDIDGLIKLLHDKR